MGSIKNFWTYLVTGVGAIIGVLVYYLSLKNKEINTLKVKVALADTEKKTDVIEVEIKEIRDSKKRLNKEVVEIDKVLNSLSEKRKEIKEKVKNMSPEELAEYWNNS